MRALTAPGVRLIHLYLLLASSPKPYSLYRLSAMFKCSRQTILRHLEQLESVDSLRIESWREGREKVVRGEAGKDYPICDISPDGLRHLLLCRDLVGHLMPDALCDEMKSAADAASRALGGSCSSSGRGESFGKGLIDYGPFQEQIAGIQQAMRQAILCKVHYAARNSEVPKAYLVAPFLLKRPTTSVSADGARTSGCETAKAAASSSRLPRPADARSCRGS